MDFTVESDARNVFAGDASVIGFNRPVRNLFKTFESEEDEQMEKTSVYLRIRPIKKTESLPFTIKNHEIIVAKDTRIKDKSTGTEFKFSHVFGPKTEQIDIYSKCIETSIKDFLNGKNCAVMAYGISGAGKTHTLLGTNGQPGIVPRALYTIFKAVRNQLSSDTLLLPTDYDEVVILDAELKDKFMRSKTTLLKKSAKVKSLSSHSSIACLNKENDMSTEFDSSQTAVLWVSFLEIYNEYVYDLLAPSTMHNKRPKLKLCENKNGNTYVKDLTMIPVRSADEAYAIMQLGQKNINYSSTQINDHSSRSHCIFKLSLVSSDGECANISTFKFCDLAGSERASKAQASGNVMKESQYINASLHVLGRCLKLIRDNQKSTTKKQMIVPYRESKLTKLFQEELSGNAKLSILVAINPDPSFFSESIETLNFAAIAKEIVMQRKTSDRKSVRISSQWLVPKSRSTEIPLPVIEYFDDSNDSDTEIYSLMADKDSYIDQILYENEKLKDELEQKEQSVRSMMVKEFQKLMEKKDVEHKQRLEEIERTYEERMKKAIEIAILRTRSEYEPEPESESDTSSFNDSQISGTNEVLVLTP